MTGSRPYGEGWVSRQVDAMAAAWGRGDRVTAAEILGRHPEADGEAAVRLIYEEVCLRREAGLDVDTTSVVRRHPRWGDEIRALLECDRLLGPGGPAGAWPAAGEDLGPFRLLAELGRGASGATFLAHDAALADRPVVVKVIPDDQEEHLALARLRHTHIVPLFSEHTFPERGLRALCMPYLGGASLALVLGGVSEVPPASRSGRLLVELVDRHTAPTPGAIREAPFRRALERETYVRAVTWIAACLADALHYAHARGLVHMDVKPSNVLITVDGQPMLLDFHLSRPPLRAGEVVLDRLGGTPGWMAPEQRSALDAAGAGEPVPAAVDGRADIYALGLILRLAFSGPGGEPGRGPTGVGTGLADVVRKCLDPAPEGRYPSAAALADDLRRHLNDLPLQGVANRDPAERWRKWRRRHPGAAAWSVTAAAVLLTGAAALGVLAAGHRQRVRQLESALAVARRDNEAGRYEQAAAAVRRALDDARGLAGAGPLRASLGGELRRARRAATAQALHALADLIRYRYGVDPPPPDDARSLAEQCRAVWGLRHDLGLEPGRPDRDEQDRRIRSDLVEVAAIRADLLVGLAEPGEAGRARLEAMEMLDRAEEEFGGSLALDLCRARLAGRPPRVDAVDGARSAWELYDLGRDHLRAGRLDQADAAFRGALALRPDDLWSNFYQGLCAFRLGRHAEAVAAFRACIALEPGSAIAWYNRALAREAMGQVGPALDDYAHAIERDPALVPAYLNRGVLAYEQGRPADAADDFGRGLRAGPTDRATRGRLHLNRALAALAMGRRSAAVADAEAAVVEGSEEARPFLEDLRAGRPVAPPPARRR